MELIFRFEYLDVKRAVWSEILHCPGSQDGLMVLTGSRHIKDFFPPPFLSFSNKSTCINIIWLMSGLSVNRWMTAHTWPWITKLITVLLTAAMRSTSLRLLRMKQASASSILLKRPKENSRIQNNGGEATGSGHQLTETWPKQIWVAAHMDVHRWSPSAARCTCALIVGNCACIRLAQTGECKMQNKCGEDLRRRQVQELDKQPISFFWLLRWKNPWQIYRVKLCNCCRQSSDFSSAARLSVQLRRAL